MTAASGALIDSGRIAALAEQPVNPLSKAVPPEAAGLSVAEFVAERPALRQLHLPQLTLDDSALTSNIATMQSWLADTGLSLAPHGKTTMAPQLWQRQLEAGAWGITIANPAQLKVARYFGVATVMLANPLLDPAALRWVAGELNSGRPWRLLCWADSVAAVQLMDTALSAAGGNAEIEVCVELGAPGGRTGCRTPEQARQVAAAIEAAGQLRLAGVAGYEGALAHDGSADSLAVIDGYLATVAALHRSLTARYEVARPVVTVGGSAYFDRVAEVLGPLADGRTEVVLRSGAYVVHDDGFYAGISPLDRIPVDATRGPRAFRSAMHAWSTVLSRPEPGLALLDAGKRDLSFDEGLPTAQQLRRAGEPAPLTATRVTAVNDQHLFLELDPLSDVAVGDVVRLGLSHPCTALDKWSVIALIDDADAVEPRVIDLIATYF